MSDSITKILFRRGLDVTRRTGGGDGVKFNVGEPAFCIDTKRLYMGDGTDSSGTIGGIPAGVKNHGSFTSLFGGTTASLATATINTLTANGVDIGDIMFDNNGKVLYYVSAKSPLSALPDTANLTRFDLIGRVAGTNGITNTKSLELVTTSLDSNYFSVNNSTGINLLSATTIGNLSNPSPLTVFGALTLNNQLTVSDKSFLNGDAVVGSSSVHANLSAYGILFASGASSIFTTPGRNSNDWSSHWTAYNSASGTLSAAAVLVNNLSPFAWVWSTGSTTISTYGGTTYKVGINTSPAFAGLAVKGTSTIATALSVFGTIEATGDLIAYSSSDERLKTNIKPITFALEKLDSIKGVYFDWNCDYRKGSDVGVIAQDVQTSFPEAVITRPDDMLAIKYDSLIPLLIQAVKELQYRVVRLERELQKPE